MRKKNGGLNVGFRDQRPIEKIEEMSEKCENEESMLELTKDVNS